MLNIAKGLNSGDLLSWESPLKLQLSPRGSAELPLYQMAPSKQTLWDLYRVSYSSEEIEKLIEMNKSKFIKGVVFVLC